MIFKVLADRRAGFLAALIALCSWPAILLAQTGDVTGVHDPSIIRSGNIFYVFSTGRGVSVRSSTDLFHWKRLGRAFAQNPQWTAEYGPGGSFWAADISFVDGEYRLYYAASRFGQTASAIGLSVNKTIDPTHPEYRWIDRGKVIQTPGGNNWNAIDPCVFDDAQGNNWMVLGSCWSGIKLVQLDRKTGMLADGREAPLAIAANPPGNIIEEGYIRRHGDFYYLWVSHEYCCRGIQSTYCLKVGRSKDVRGPYLDRDGKPMLRGGGTLVLASYGNVRGPGSCAIIPFANREYLIHHEYDAGNRGTPTLQIRQLFWADDGWPVVGESIVRPPEDKPPPARPVTGEWSVRQDFQTPRSITLREDGTLSPAAGAWHLEGSQLRFSWAKAAAAITEQFTLADDGSFFVGRNADGAAIIGSRAQPVSQSR